MNTAHQQINNNQTAGFPRTPTAHQRAISKSKDLFIMKRLNEMKLTSVVMIALLVSACSSQEKTYTVPELLKDPVLMEKIKKWCDESPGERMAIPNCGNIIEAKRQQFIKNMHDEVGKPMTYPKPITKWN